jgi:hypothetical protein
LEGTQTWKLGRGSSSKEMKREMSSLYIHYTIEVLICQAFLSFCSFFCSPCFSYSTGLI